MAESRNKLVYLVLDELNRPISLGGMEDGDTISDDLLSTEVRNAASGFDGVSATVYDNSSTWDEGIDPDTLTDLITASSRTDTLVTFSASVETSTANLSTSTADISGYINTNESAWAAGLDAGTLLDIESVSATVLDGSTSWDNTFNKVDSASDAWDGAYTSALATSAYIQANEAAWSTGIDAGTLLDIESVSATVLDGSGDWNNTYDVIASVSANHFLSSVDGVSILDGNLEIGNSKTISSTGSYILSADNVITLAPGGNLNLSSDLNVRLVPTGDVQIKPILGDTYISGISVTLESTDGYFSIGTAGGTPTPYNLVTVLDDAIALKVWSGTVDTSVVDLDADIATLNIWSGTVDASVVDLDASTTALNIWSGTVDTSVVDLDADIAVLDASTTALNIWSGTVDTSVVDLDADIAVLDGRIGTVESTDLFPSATGFENWNTAYSTDLFPSATGFENWNTAYSTDLFPSAAGFENWNTAYSTDLFPSATGFVGWNATKDTVDAGQANWDGAYASALTASAYILENEGAWLAGGGSDNPSGTASAMGVYLGSSVAISGFGPGDDTPTGPIANQYLAFKASDSRFRYVEPPLRFISTEAVGFNQEGLLALEGGGPTITSFALDVGLDLSGWFNQTEYDITPTTALANQYIVDIDFDQAQVQAANLSIVSGAGTTTFLTFSNISPGRRTKVTLYGDPTYSTTIGYLAGAINQPVWVSDQLNTLAAGESVELTLYSRGTDGSSLYVYSTKGDISHSTLSDLANDDHTQYHNDSRADTWLATKNTDDLLNDSTVAGTTTTDALNNLSGVIITDHGGLGGLADDDHTQYVLADGTRSMDSLSVTGNVDVTGTSTFNNTITFDDGTALGTIQNVSNQFSVSSGDAYLALYGDALSLSSANNSIVRQGSDQFFGHMPNALIGGLDAYNKKDSGYYSSFLQLEEAGGGQNINQATKTYISFDTSSGGGSTSTDYAWNGSDTLTINTAGTYEISVNIGVVAGGTNSANQRTATVIRCEKAGTDFGPTGKTGYIRLTTGHEEASHHLSTFVTTFTAGQALKVGSTREATATGSVLTSAGECFFYIRRII